MITCSELYNLIPSVQLLEGLGVFKRNSKRKDDPYQDTVSAPLDRDFDEEAVGHGNRKGMLICCNGVYYSHIAIHLASKDHSRSTRQPPTASSLAERGYHLPRGSGECLESCCSYAHPGREDSMVFNPSNASYVPYL